MQHRNGAAGFSHWNCWIETERLILRRYKAEDLNDLFEYLSDDEVVKYEPYKAMTLEETKENLKWRMETDEMIAVELKENHKMIEQSHYSICVSKWCSQNICRM